VEVTDELGNIYYKTYYKRAQGLIKKGRARLISENRICLTEPCSVSCPPNNIINNNAGNGTIKSEDKYMMNQTQDIVAFVQDKISELYEEYKGAAPGEYDEQISGGMIAVMKRLLDTAVKMEALDKLTHLDFTTDHMGAKATGDIVQIYNAILNYKS
jgi:hypothetical protein